MPFNAVRRVCTAIVEHTLQYERVNDTPRKHNAGHTYEYAQHDDGYPLMAFHDYKITE